MGTITKEAEDAMKRSLESTGITATTVIGGAGKGQADDSEEAQDAEAFFRGALRNGGADAA